MRYGDGGLMEQITLHGSLAPFVSSLCDNFNLTNSTAFFYPFSLTAIVTLHFAFH